MLENYWYSLYIDMRNQLYSWISKTTAWLLWLACSSRVQYIDGSSSGRVKPNIMKLVFVASPQYQGERESNNCLARGQDNVSESSDMSIVVSMRLSD